VFNLNSRKATGSRTWPYGEFAELGVPFPCVKPIGQEKWITVEIPTQLRSSLELRRICNPVVVATRPMRCFGIPAA
jgi:hypothetical protein